MALRDAAAQGHSAREPLAYLTLEPCAHHGASGPCFEALIAAGVAQVVGALTDPNPQVAGQGFARLQAAGVAVEVGAGAAASRALNIGFFSRMERGRPWVRLKAATSLDGATALGNGASQSITQPGSTGRWPPLAGAGLCGADGDWHDFGGRPAAERSRRGHAAPAAGGGGG